MHKVTSIVGLIFALSYSDVPIISAAPTIRTVALSGRPAPGTADGAVFANLGTPVLNNAGKTAFTSRLALDVGGVTRANDQGIWTEGHGTLTLIAREGFQAPGTPNGVVFGGVRASGVYLINAPFLSEAGQTVFTTTLLNGIGGVNQNNDSGIWSERDGTLALIVREGDQAPGTPLGAVFRAASNNPQFSVSAFDSFASNSAGNVAFNGALQLNAGVITADNNSGIWAWENGSIALTAREGDIAPGMPDSTTFGGFCFGCSTPMLNDFGQTAFSNHATTASGIWLGGTETLALVVRSGEPAPGTAAGAVFDLYFQTPAINNAGQIAFLSALVAGNGDVTDQNDWGIWSGTRDTLTLVTREGDHAPGTLDDAVFGKVNNSVPFGDPVLNYAGHVLFVAQLRHGVGDATDENDSGLWSNIGGALALVAREGDQVPGAIDGVMFDGFFDGALAYCMNGSGQVAFFATMKGTGITDESRVGLWASDRAGNLKLVARSGALMDVDDGAGIDLRMISWFSTFGHTGGEDGRRIWFNDLGQIAFLAAFTDGSQGVFVSNAVAIPEPSTLLPLVGCCFALSMVRRLRRSSLTQY